MPCPSYSCSTGKGRAGFECLGIKMLRSLMKEQASWVVLLPRKAGDPLAERILAPVRCGVGAGAVALVSSLSAAPV